MKFPFLKFAKSLKEKLANYGFTGIQIWIFTEVPWFQCIVAAGSVFARNFPNTCLIEGIPAKIIKEHIKWKWLMNLYNNTVTYRFNKFIREHFILPQMRKRLKNKKISILCNNCIGGIVSLELGLRFNSPTVNLYFENDDFFSFLKTSNIICLNLWSLERWKMSGLNIQFVPLVNRGINLKLFYIFFIIKVLMKHRCHGKDAKVELIRIIYLWYTHLLTELI